MMLKLFRWYLELEEDNCFLKNSIELKQNEPFKAFGGALVVINVYTSDHGPAPESFFAHIRKLYGVFSCNLFILCE
jgi:hypothetical protein